MQYDLDIESVSTIRRRLHFKVDDKLVRDELDRAFDNLKRRVRLPGFRPGKVPRKLLEARFGQQIRGEVSSNLVDRAWREAVPQLEVAGRPALEDSADLDGKSPFTFTIGVDVRPEITLDGYQGVEVPYRAPEVSDEVVDARVQARLSTKTVLAEVTDRPVQDGDEVLTQIKLVQGEGDEAETVAEEYGTKIFTSGDRFYPGLEGLLVGLEVEGEASGEVTIGEGSEFEHLSGQTLQAEVKVLGIQARTTPELTDEAAEELGYEGGVDGMKAAIRMEIEQQAEEAARQNARVKLLEKLVNSNEFDVPDALVDEQFEALQEEMKVRRSYSGEDPRAIRFSDAELADLRQRGRFAAKAALILEAIARQEGIEVADADLDAKIAEIAGSRMQAPEAIRGYLEREGAMPVLRTRVSEEKTLEWLLENAELVDPPAEEEAPAAEAAPAAEEAPAEEAAPVEEAATEQVAEKAPWKKSWKKAELLEAAKARGLSVNTKNTKAQIVEALEADDA